MRQEGLPALDSRAQVMPIGGREANLRYAIGRALAYSTPRTSESSSAKAGLAVSTAFSRFGSG